MKQIHFKFNGGKGSPFDMKIGWLALGNHGVHHDGPPLLSPDCVSVAEIEEQADYLEKPIDTALGRAKRKLPN
jgi:hypothetical protein